MTKERAVEIIHSLVWDMADGCDQDWFDETITSIMNEKERKELGIELFEDDDFEDDNAAWLC